MSDNGTYCNCAAYRCNMLGTMSRNTNGSKEWFCFIHFGADSKRWSDISDELERLSWLVEITRNLRQFGNAKEWDQYDEAARKEITLNQSSHLLLSNKESLAQWCTRLEGVLHQSCAAPSQRDIDLPPVA